MQKNEATRKSASSKKAAATNLILGALLLLECLPGFWSHSPHVSPVSFCLRICVAVLGLLLILLGLFGGSVFSAFGTICHEQVFDSRLEQRVRERYAAEIRQLTFLGFNYVFTESESFSVSRLLLIFPAISLLMMLVKREVLALGRGGRVLLVLPIFCSADGRAFAHPFALGVKFQTAFRNGLLLITKNFKDDCCETPEFVVQAADRTVSETWQTHQEWLDRLDREANPAKRDCSYQAYAAISSRESDFQRSQM